MKLIFLERDNVTDASDPDQDGDSYSASFEFFPFQEGATFAVYKGVLNGDGCKKGQFCAVKTLVEKAASFGELNSVVRRAQEAQRLAQLFNALLGYPAVSFAVPATATLKHVSDFNGFFRCFFPHDKRLARDEHLLIETFIDGEFQIFNSNNGTVPSGHVAARDKSKKKVNAPNLNKRDHGDPGGRLVGSNNLAQAFGHFAWFMTGSSVICALKGVFSNSHYSFTTPVIHSTSSSFGATDGGPEAIGQFFASHRCTNLCRTWPTFSPSSCNSRKQVNFFQPDSKTGAEADRNVFHSDLCPNKL